MTRLDSGVSPQFQHSIAANLRHWHGRVHALPTEAYATLDLEREGLFRAVIYGLRLSETWQLAAGLALTLVEYVETSGLWRTWIPLFERALDTCPLDNPLLRGQLTCRLGFLYRLNGQVSAALEMHRLAFAQSEICGDLVEKGLAHLGLSDEFYLTKDYTEAKTHAQAGLEALIRAGETGPRLRSAFNLSGMIAHDTGAYLEAVGHYQDALNARHGKDQPQKRAQVLMNLANTLTRLKRYTEGRAVLEETLMLLQHTGNTLLFIHAQNALGALYFAMEDWEGAEAAFQAMDSGFLQQFGHTQMLASKANNLGNVYLKQGAYAAAREQLAYAAQLFRELSDELNLGNTLGDLGETYSRQGELIQARQCWEEALTLLSKYPQNAWAGKRSHDILVQRDQLEV